MTTSGEFQALLDRIEALAVRNAETSRRNVDLMVERGKLISDVKSAEGRLEIAQSGLRDFENRLTNVEVRMATMRVDLKEMTDQRDKLRQAGKALVEVRDGRGVKSRRSTAELILKRRLDEIDEQDIPF